VSIHTIFLWKQLYGSTNREVETLKFNFSSEHAVVYGLFRNNKSNFVQFLTSGSNVSVMNVSCL